MTDKDKTVCFTGHRILKRDFDVSKVDEVIDDLIGKGYIYFLDGMALGFDMLCCERLLAARERHPDIRIIACIPCADQEETFPPHEAERYAELLKHVDEKVVLCGEYTQTCMRERNRYMVDRSSACVSYLYKSSGGTYYTTAYAQNAGVEIIYIK